MPARLTIAIPTYNRAARLQAQLARVVPQLGAEAACCVYDNASTDTTPEVARSFAAQGVVSFRSPFNYGPERNFLRCFEECQTEWLWVLSDDDPIEPDAVRNILQLIARGQHDFIHLSASPKYYDREIEVTDAMALLDHASPSAVNLISLGIYNMRSFRPLLAIFLRNFSTTVPQMAMILSLLESGRGRALLSPTVVLTAPTGVPRWSTTEWLLGLSMMLESLQGERLQRRLAAQLVVENFNWGFLIGLREAKDAAGRRRWKRTYSKAAHNYAAHVRCARLRYILKNFLKAGQRKTCFKLLLNGWLLSLLRWSPPFVFNALRARLGPRSESACASADRT